MPPKSVQYHHIILSWQAVVFLGSRNSLIAFIPKSLNISINSCNCQLMNFNPLGYESTGGLDLPASSLHPMPLNPETLPYFVPRNFILILMWKFFSITWSAVFLILTQLALFIQCTNVSWPYLHLLWFLPLCFGTGFVSVQGWRFTYSTFLQQLATFTSEHKFSSVLSCWVWHLMFFLLVFCCLFGTWQLINERMASL